MISSERDATANSVLTLFHRRCSDHILVRAGMKIGLFASNPPFVAVVPHFLEVEFLQYTALTKIVYGDGIIWDLTPLIGDRQVKKTVLACFRDMLIAEKFQDDSFPDDLEEEILTFLKEVVGLRPNHNFHFTRPRLVATVR